MIPIAQGGPPPDANAIDADELDALVRDSGLVPLLLTSAGDAKHSDLVLCYHVDELAAGRSTIVGIPMWIDYAGGPIHCGDSLLSVWHEHRIDDVRRLTKEFHSPYNRGAGSLDQDELDGAKNRLAAVEALVHALAERTR